MPDWLAVRCSLKSQEEAPVGEHRPSMYKDPSSTPAPLNSLNMTVCSTGLPQLPPWMTQATQHHKVWPYYKQILLQLLNTFHPIVGIVAMLHLFWSFSSHQSKCILLFVFFSSFVCWVTPSNAYALVNYAYCTQGSCLVGLREPYQNSRVQTHVGYIQGKCSICCTVSLALPK